MLIYFDSPIKKDEPLPRRLKYRQHLYKEGNLMEEKAKTYFTEKGYLIPEIVKEK
jgi:hypothetical protein